MPTGFACSARITSPPIPVSTSASAAFWRRPHAPEEAAASLATGTKRRSASQPNPALDAGEGRSTCGHQPTNGAKWPEARTGLVWWDGVSGCWLLISSYASHRGLTLAPDEPRPAATAILRIEALAAEFSQNRLARDASAKQKTRHVRLSCRTACPARTERKPTAEFVEYLVVVAHDLIAESRATCSGRSRPILFALSSPLRRVMC